MKEVSTSSAFTVVELIVVVGALSMLLAIALPAVRSVRNGSYKRRAAAEATELAQAVIRYKAEYGFWPGEVVLDSPGDTSVKLHNEIRSTDFRIFGLLVSGPQTFLNSLRAQSDGTLNVLKLATNEVYQCFARANLRQGGTRHTNPLNPKGISFVSLDNENDWEKVGKTDPWGNSYRILMGMNPRSSFKLLVNDRLITTVSNVTAFAFSTGTPENAFTNYIFSEGVSK